MWCCEKNVSPSISVTSPVFRLIMKMPVGSFSENFMDKNIWSIHFEQWKDLNFLYLCTFHCMEIVSEHTSCSGINIDWIVEKYCIVFCDGEAVNLGIVSWLKGCYNFWFWIVKVIWSESLQFNVVTLEEIACLVLVVERVVSSWLPLPMSSSRSCAQGICRSVEFHCL